MDLGDSTHKATLLQSLVTELWKPIDGAIPTVYALLDGARDKRIEPLVNNSRLEHDCLYSGKLNYALKRAAPHIVKVEPNDKLFRTIVEEGWGNSWGIFAVVPPGVKMQTVRNNCRRLAKVEAPGGKTMVFRYYDPRVLRDFLPTCLPVEIKRIFGPVSVYVGEGEDINQLNQYLIDPVSKSLNVRPQRFIAQ